jgi:Zn-dependent protease
VFIEALSDDPLFFWSVAFTAIMSITLHELAHGWTAIRLGDETPRLLGHMTWNPLVHMGPISFLALALAGIAWGAMPVDPSRLKGRYGDSKVALAGPAMNLGIGVTALVVLGLWQRFSPGPTPETGPVYNITFLLWTLGYYNLMLFAFNLLPIPPFDGSRIVANLHRGYSAWASDPRNTWMMFILFPIAFFFARYMWPVVTDVAGTILTFVRGS